MTTMDCGTLVHQRCLAPFLVGCLLPHTVIRSNRLLHTSLEAHITFANGQGALEVIATVQENDQLLHQAHFTFYDSMHHDFLASLSEASALYLLTGSEHPGAHLEQRLHEGGLAIEVRDDVRSQIHLLFSLSQAVPKLEKHA